MLKKRRRLFQKTTAAGLALLLMTSVLMMSAGAASAWPRGEIPHRVHTWYENIPVRVESNAVSVSDCYLINETTYAPLRSLCDAVLPAAKIDFNAATRTARVSADGLYLTAQEGSHYIVANGRYLYSDTPVVILDDGRTYIPIRALAKALGVGIAWNAATRSVTVTGEYTPILSGDKFYDADAVYWLSRIISAESQGEPLLGQIAVGNVVLNRVAHKDFPNTIWGVIFDRRYGVQFTPVANGTVYHEPYYLSVIAAKLCLEGVTVSDRVLYFMNPAISTSFWISSHRPYAFRIGTHQFYY
ncbi:MAG: cell wall hydrolase [Clostridia bacterium]|nr:cell wall hydrolase [Clostridia bacterium]